MTENEIRNLVVSTAKKYLGYKESDGSHRKIIDIYNSHKPLARGYAVTYKDPWCATFVSAVAILCGLTDIMPTECSCSKMISLHKKLGTWKETDSYKPEPGDLVMYDWHDSKPASENTNDPDHVGIVVSVSGSTIKVIEGNYSNSVKYRSLAVNGKYIRGFCLPDYASKATKEKEKSIDELAQEVLAGKHGNGEERKKSLGDQYEAVQDRVNELMSGKQEVDIDALARDVIAGKYGSGEERKKKLGSLYQKVQDRVNEMLGVD